MTFETMTYKKDFILSIS